MTAAPRPGWPLPPKQRQLLGSLGPDGRVAPWNHAGLCDLASRSLVEAAFLRDVRGRLLKGKLWRATPAGLAALAGGAA